MEKYGVIVCKSSNVKFLLHDNGDFDKNQQNVLVCFNNGKMYIYIGVPKESLRRIYSDVANEGSLGKSFISEIRSKTPAENVYEVTAFDNAKFFELTNRADFIEEMIDDCAQYGIELDAKTM